MEELKYFLFEYPALPALITAIVLFITLIIQTWTFVKEGQRREEEKNIQLASEAINRYEKYINKKIDSYEPFKELENDNSDLESTVYKVVIKTMDKSGSYYEIRNSCFPILKNIIYQLKFCLNTFDKLSDTSREIYYALLQNIVDHEIEMLIYLEYCFLDKLANHKYYFDKQDLNEIIDYNEKEIFQIYKNVVNYNTSDVLEKLQSELINRIDMSILIPEMERKIESGDFIEADFFIFYGDS